MSGVFVEVGWRSGLGAGSREVGLETQKNEARGRRRRKRGAGGRSRCVRWPRCALCGCAALKSAHLTSPQTVSATVQNNKPKSELFSFFSTADAVDGGQERARLVGLEPGRDVGQVVALAEQNAIDLVPAPCRTLNFGTTATASLLAKMTITHSTNVHRDQVIIYSMFDRLMRGAMRLCQKYAKKTPLKPRKPPFFSLSLFPFFIFAPPP